jgi:hypothetical protein
MERKEGNGETREGGAQKTKKGFKNKVIKDRREGVSLREPLRCDEGICKETIDQDRGGETRVKGGDSANNVGAEAKVAKTSQKVVPVDPIISFFLIQENKGACNGGVASRVQNLGNGHSVVLDAPTLHKACLGGVNERLDDRLDAVGQDLGKEFAVTVEEGNRAPVLKVTMITFVLVNECDVGVGEGGREGTRGEGIREEGGKEGRELSGKLFVEFKGKAICSGSTPISRSLDGKGNLLRGNRTVKKERILRRKGGGNKGE